MEVLNRAIEIFLLSPYIYERRSTTIGSVFSSVMPLLFLIARSTALVSIVCDVTRFVEAMPL